MWAQTVAHEMEAVWWSPAIDNKILYHLAKMRPDCPRSGSWDSIIDITGSIRTTPADKDNIVIELYSDRIQNTEIMSITMSSDSNYTELQIIWKIIKFEISVTTPIDITVDLNMLKGLMDCNPTVYEHVIYW